MKGKLKDKRYFKSQGSVNMSDVIMEIPKLSLLDQLKMQRAQFSVQKDMAQNNFNQLVGAIFACDEMIKKHEEDAAKVTGLSQENLGGQGNGETDNESS